MFFHLLGEGASDLGYSKDNPGPLVHALDCLAKEKTDVPFEYDYVSDDDLKEATKNSFPKKMLYRGKKRTYPNLIFIQRTAEGLGSIARKTDNCGSVFFHDCDFTRSEVKSPDDYYRQMVVSIENGFAQADYHNGVAMVPKPRSESWLLCRYQETPYHNCKRFEDLPGNDASEKSGKKKLAEFFHCPENQIYERINADDIEWNRIDAPSFVFFKNRFQHVVERLTHQTTTLKEPETLMSTQEQV